MIPFSAMVRKLAKSGEAILTSLTPLKCHMWHMASCIPGEAGELFDAVKKYVIYGKPLDRENIVEELGDLEFYMEGLRDSMGITREEVIEANQRKLAKRYGENFEYADQKARDRADKS